MNFYCNSGGTIFHVDPERIFQGSAGVNTIRFIGQFPSSAQVLLAYKLPNGNLTSQKVLTLVDELAEVEAPDNGGKFSVWETVLGAVPRLDSNGRVLKDDNGNVVYGLDFTITENYGTATLQFFVYAASNSITVNGQVYNVKGGLLATASSNFTIEKGAPALIPTVEELTSNDSKILLAEILNIVSNYITNVDNAVEAANAIVKEVTEKLETGAFTGAAGPKGDKGDPGKDGAIKIIPVNELPTENIDTSAMYLLRIAETGNRFQAYMFIDGEWEPFEQIEIGGDLTDYVKFTDYANYNTAGIVYTPDGDEVYNGGIYFKDGKAFIVGSARSGGLSDAFFNNPKVYSVPILAKDLYRWMRVGLVQNDETWTYEDKTKACETIGAVKAMAGEPDSGATRGFAYGLDSYGTTQKLFRVQIQANADTIPLRNQNANFYVGAATLPYECANKGYVDNLPDYLTLTAEQKAKWQKFIGSNAVQVLTQAEYDALETKAENVVYIISDSSDTLETIQAIIDGTMAVPKAKLLELGDEFETSGYTEENVGLRTTFGNEKTGLYQFRLYREGVIYDLGTLYFDGTYNHKLLGSLSTAADSGSTVPYGFFLEAVPNGSNYHVYVKESGLANTDWITSTTKIRYRKIGV